MRLKNKSGKLAFQVNAFEGKVRFTNNHQAAALTMCFWLWSFAQCQLLLCMRLYRSPAVLLEGQPQLAGIVAEHMPSGLYYGSATMSGRPEWTKYIGSALPLFGSQLISSSGLWPGCFPRSHRRSSGRRSSCRRSPRVLLGYSPSPQLQSWS